MFCETEIELALLRKLQLQFPECNEYLLSLTAWVQINKPELFEEIMREHQDKYEMNICSPK